MDTDRIGSILDRIAPTSLAESWDNPGWQVRVPARPVTGILLTVDVTLGVLEEALRRDCNLIFAHHPLLFKPIGSLDLGSPRGSLIAEIVRSGASVWAAHTNLDVMPGGTSFALAAAIGLQDVRVLSPVDRREYKLVVYVPATHVDTVKEAMASAGAGRIGNYSHCFWQVLGTGQFRPEEGASPYLGGVGREERVEEFRVEGVVPHAVLAAVLEAMRRSHPYEEVAYDLLPLANRVTLYGYGAIGELGKSASTARIARDVAARLSSALCSVVGDPNRTHRRVAVAGGSGGGLLGDAIRGGATLFITADVRYHDSQDAGAGGLDLVILDHFATERPVLESVQAQLARLLPNVPALISQTPTSPYVSVKP